MKVKGPAPDQPGIKIRCLVKPLQNMQNKALDFPSSGCFTLPNK